MGARARAGGELLRRGGGLGVGALSAAPVELENDTLPRFAVLAILATETRTSRVQDIDRSETRARVDGGSPLPSAPETHNIPQPTSFPCCSHAHLSISESYRIHHPSTRPRGVQLHATCNITSARAHRLAPSPGRRGRATGGRAEHTRPRRARAACLAPGPGRTRRANPGRVSQATGKVLARYVAGPEPMDRPKRKICS